MVVVYLLAVYDCTILSCHVFSLDYFGTPLTDSASDCGWVTDLLRLTQDFFFIKGRHLEHG